MGYPMNYDYDDGGVARQWSRRPTGCTMFREVSIPADAPDATLAALGLTPHVEPVPTVPTLEEAQTARMAELTAEYDAAVAAAFPIALRLEILTGIRESGGMDALQTGVQAFRDVRDAAAAQIAAAADLAAVAAVTWAWPEIEVLP